MKSKQTTNHEKKSETPTSSRWIRDPESRIIESKIDYLNKQGLKAGDVIQLVDRSGLVYDYAILLSDPYQIENIPVIKVKSQKTTQIYELTVTNDTKKI